MSESQRAVGLRYVPAWMILVLGILATIILWSGQTTLLAGEKRLLWLGLIVTAVLWQLVIASAMNRAKVRQLRRDLEALRNREELALTALRAEPEEEANQSIGLKYVPAWMVLLLGVVTTIMLWRNTLPILASGVATSVVLWLLVVAHAMSRLRARRLARAFRQFRKREEITLATLHSLRGLISACLPDGRRSRFNDRFTEFTGCTEDELAEHGWLECVHAEDRQQCLEMIADHARRPKDEIEIDYSMRGADGEYHWMRETLQPRLDSDGALLEYIGCAHDITAQVKNETEQDETIGKLREELKTTKGELGKTRRARDRFQKKIEAAQQDAQEAEQRFGASRKQLIEARTELKSLQSEYQQLEGENKRLTQSFQELEGVINALEKSERDLRDQIARNLKQQSNAKKAEDQARRNESQHRAKSTRLSTRCQELEEQLAAASAAAEEARARAAAAEEARAQAEADAQAAIAAPTPPEQGPPHAGLNGDGALTEELRGQLDGFITMAGLLSDSPLDDLQRGQIENAHACAEAMARLIDQALGKAKPPARKQKLQTRAFSLRMAAEGACDLLQKTARDRDVTLVCSVSQDLPSQVGGDPVRFRHVLMYLLNSAIRLVEDGEITLRLSQDGTTATHATVRCEIAHASARIPADRMEQMFSMKATASKKKHAAEDDPNQYQAAVAWQIVSQMGGQFAYELPDQGGFALWLTLTMPKQTVVGELAPTRNEPQQTSPRLPQEFLKCNLGKVLELGADGVRVQATKVPKGAVNVSFQDLDEPLKLRAEVAASNHLGGRKHDVVLRFIDPTPAQRQQIQQVAMEHRKCTTVPVEADGTGSGG